MFTTQNAINVLLILALVRLLKRLHNPIIPAFVYSLATFIYSYLAGGELKLVMVASILAFGAALIYFWLLERFSDTLVWWFIFILGLVIALL